MKCSFHYGVDATTSHGLLAVQAIDAYVRLFFILCACARLAQLTLKSEVTASLNADTQRAQALGRQLTTTACVMAGACDSA